jgi:hypothetical protein
MPFGAARPRAFIYPDCRIRYAVAGGELLETKSKVNIKHGNRYKKFKMPSGLA